MGCAQRKGLLSNDVFVVALYYPPGNEVRSLRTNVLSDKKQVNNAYASIISRKRKIAHKKDKNRKKELKEKKNKVKSIKYHLKGEKYDVKDKRKKVEAYVDLVSQED